MSITSLKDIICREEYSPTIFLTFFTSVLGNFPGGNRKIVSCLLIVRPIPRTSATPAQTVNVSYKLPNLAGQIAACQNSNSSGFLPSSGSQEAADVLHSNRPFFFDILR